jgi:REase_DpnII-MboI
MSYPHGDSGSCPHCGIHGLVDLETLYSMADNAARNAERMCGHDGGLEGEQSYRRLGGYPSYIREYNRLLEFTAAADPDARRYLDPIDMGEHADPAYESNTLWGVYAEQAAVALRSLATYLQSRLGRKQQEYEQIIDLIRANLRPAIYEDPKHEREVQNALETIFRARALDFRREQETVSYSTKRYIPDFTFDRIGLAVEVKLCKEKDREKAMIDEINADIIGYAGKYDRSVFVIYDLGFIRDVAKFSEDIEKNPNVHVLIIKK